MATGKATPKVSTILDIWASTKEERDAKGTQRNFKMLKTKGNEMLINLEGAMDDAVKAVDDAKFAAKKNPDFKAIANAELAYAAAELELTHAIGTYKSIFGELPSIA